MNAVRGVCNGSLATRQRAKKEVEKMKITKTINTATVVLATVEVKDGKAEPKNITAAILSCEPLSDAKIAKAVRRINPKAVIVSVDQHSDKYAIDINDFVKFAHVEQ